MRWIVAQKNRVRNGELYRFIADSKGAFVQVCTHELDQAAAIPVLSGSL
jgi:sucrose synthase